MTLSPTFHRPMLLAALITISTSSSNPWREGIL